MKRLRCEKCEIEAAGSWAWMWYQLADEATSAPGGKKRAWELWLCPDCAGAFRSDAARNAYLRKKAGQ